ncbi:jg3369 [Pararge aegeria aegeria]|uniref:Jg3369 protein n=1 Tax=Pararge aegeria aegeria TaxID=348720 RepID=A0A8S4RTR2_9NEOP|nr:jg3369 [Pararge aegeria aegeria]
METYPDFHLFRSLHNSLGSVSDKASANFRGDGVRSPTRSSNFSEVLNLVIVCQCLKILRGCLSDDSKELAIRIFDGCPETRNFTEHSAEVEDSGISKHARRTAIPRLF